MDKDIECPYCGEGIDIDHDEGYGYEENRAHQQRCIKCKKYFVYTTSISYYYEAEKAPCLNDGEHDWRVNRGYPQGYLSNFHTCVCCGEKEQIDKSLKYNSDKDKWEKHEGVNP